MDLYPQELMKSILIGDFEKMEGLGLPELVEEDVALCEFVCVSKHRKISKFKITKKQKGIVD